MQDIFYALILETERQGFEPWVCPKRHTTG